MKHLALFGLILSYQTIFAAYPKNRFEFTLANLHTKPYLADNLRYQSGNYGPWTLNGSGKNWSCCFRYHKPLKQVRLVTGLGYKRQSFLFSLTRFIDPLVGSITQTVTYSGVSVPVGVSYRFKETNWQVSVGFSVFKPIDVEQSITWLVLSDFKTMPTVVGYYDYKKYHKPQRLTNQYFFDMELSAGMNKTGNVRAGILFQAGLNQSNLIQECYLIENRVYGPVGFAPIFNNLSFYGSFAF